MRCHKCNQNSIEVENGKILCKICGLEIDISINLEEDPLLDLFLYNRELGESKELGKKDYRDNVSRETNPYSLESSEIMLKKKWEEGWDEENIGYEREAFSSSVEKLNIELEKLERKVKDAEEERKKFLFYYKTLKQCFINLSNTKYIFGRTYRYDIDSIVEEMEFLDNPDK